MAERGFKIRSSLDIGDTKVIDGDTGDITLPTGVKFVDATTGDINMPSGEKLLDGTTKDITLPSGAKIKINDAEVVNQSGVDFSKIVNRPNTISGFGITDAYPKSHFDTNLFTGDLSGSFGSMTVAKFAGQSPSYYRNFGNLTNKPEPFNTGNYSFPSADGGVNQVLKTNGSGVLTWQDESGGGGGVTALSDLSDVKDSLAPNGNEILVWSAVMTEWQTTTLGSLGALTSSSSIKSLTDVDSVMNPNADDALIWSGSKWTSTKPSVTSTSSIKIEVVASLPGTPDSTTLYIVTG